MADKVIVIREKKSGCGCGALIALAFAAFGIFVFLQSSKNQDQAERTEKTNESCSSRPKKQYDQKPDSMIVDMVLRKSLRSYMNDFKSYEPIKTTIANHPRGWAYIHEYRGKNSFGGVIKDMCGLLYTTNTTSWTFYNREELKFLLKDATVDGKKIIH